MRLLKVALAAATLLTSLPAAAQMAPTPARRADEGIGPFAKLVIRGVNVIEGNGGPMYGPVDIVIENNRITDVRIAGTPGKPLAPAREPRDATHEIDARGMYVLPGFVDMHGHNGDPDKAPNPDYGYKLWLAHGVTSVRGVGFFNDPARALDDKRRSAANQIVAPRMFVYQTIGSGWDRGRIDNPQMARDWVRWAAKQGIDGIKLFNRGDETPAVFAAVVDEAKKQGLGTVAHLAQPGIAEVDGRVAGALGLGTITHFYGHFESIMKDGHIQKLPPDYNFLDEQHRFGEIAEIWDDIEEPGGEVWKAYLAEQKALGVTFDPTFNIYSASRDLMRARTADWHEAYTLPSLWDFFQSNRDNHGSYFYDWTTAHETTWRNFYQRYMKLINDYKNMGGRVTTGSDPGYIFQTWGFGYILELEMLQEAGFTPLEVVQAATINGARTLHEPKRQEPPFGLVRRGMLADLVIVPENPLQNLKTLYGVGTPRLNEATGALDQVGGVRWTVKDGIVYDAHALLRDVAAMVAAEKAKRATAAPAQP
jgi:hypothetical protein